MRHKPSEVSFLAVRFYLSVILLLPLSGCALRSELPVPPPNHGVLMLGYSTLQATPYQNGTLYTGFVLEEINNVPLTVPLKYSDSVALPMGITFIKGYCYWRLRAIPITADEKKVEVNQEIEVRSNYLHTIVIDIDEYKPGCKVKLLERPLKHRVHK